MPFIKTQKIVRGEDGSIQSGSAAIVDTVYDVMEREELTQLVR